MFQIIGQWIEKYQKWLMLPLVVAMSCIAFAFVIIQPTIIEQIELKTLDERFQIRGVMQPDPHVVILAVDDNSLSEVGRWPWPRDKISTLIERIVGEYGARVIGFDIIFSEKQENPITESARLLNDAGRGNREVERYLRSHAEIGDLDSRFVKTLKKYHDKLVMGYFFHPEGADIPELTKAKLTQYAELLQGSAMTSEHTSQSEQAWGVTRIGAIEGNLPAVTKVVDASGFFNFYPDSDGLVRRVPLVAEYDGYIFPSLALQSLRVALNWPVISARIGAGGVEEVEVGEHKVQALQSGNMLINHYGPGKTFTHVPAADVLAGRADPAIFKDAIVLFGVTAIGVYDYRPSPFDEVFPGVEGHAAVVSNILNGQEIKRPPVLEVLELLAALLLSMGLGWIVLRHGPVVQSFAVLGVPVLVTLFSIWLFSVYAFWLKITYIILGVLMATLPPTLIQYIVEYRKRMFIHHAFSTYLAPDVVDDLSRHPELLRLGGEERHMTAFFSDIASFSTFSEKLTPNELVSFLNQYLTAMSNILMAQGGTIDKFEGDAIIAFFGAPQHMEDHATRCVLAAMEQQHALVALREMWKEQGYPEVHIRIGLNSGPMVVGNMGTDAKMNYTMMGDHVNLASRLEGVCKVYKVPILMSRDTYSLVRDRIAARFIDRVRVVGRAQAVDIYMPLGERGTIDERMVKLSRSYERAWTMMQTRQFGEAVELLARLTQENPDDGPSGVMLARARAFHAKSPRQDWDGVHVLESK